MSLQALLKAQLSSDPKPTPQQERLLGEIVDKRFVLLEPRGSLRGELRFEAYDMQELTRVPILVLVTPAGGIKGYLVLDGEPTPAPLPVAARAPTPAPPLPVAAAAPPPLPPLPVAAVAPLPPPLPVAALAPPPRAAAPAAPAPPPPRRRLATAHRLEAAWFAQSEQFDQGDGPDEDCDVSDRQAQLEETASSLPADLLFRYALEPV